MLRTRIYFVRSALFAAVLKGGSRAIEYREPCQVGNQAALSGEFGVPWSSLPGAAAAFNACKVLFDFKAHGSPDGPFFDKLQKCKSETNCKL